LDDLELTRYYKNYCRILTEAIKKAKHHHHNKIISNSDNNVKTTWSVIRTITSTNLGINPITSIKIGGKLCNNILKTANYINYFVSPLPQIKNSPTIDLNEALKFLTAVFKHPFPNLYMSPVTNKEVKDIVKSLKWKYSHGYDEIPQYILKLSLPFILAPLTYMCNKVFSLSVFPSRLKYSQINSIFKKGDRTDIANYRLISLLTSFSKIFERIIYNRFQHLDINNILAGEQHGFRTISCLLNQPLMTQYFLLSLSSMVLMV
jgi:hypothetical protein